jgi:hypothetical protein
MFDWLINLKRSLFLTYTVRITFFFLLFLGILAGSGCDESLPPRDNPDIIFKGDISSSYVYAPTENDCLFIIDVTNSYHETIQDTAAVKGTLEVTLKRDVRYHKTFHLTLQNFLGPFVYDPLRNLFTIDPGKKASFSATWNFIDDNGVDLTTSLFTYMTDPTCPQRYISESETFILKGSIQILHGGEIIPFGPKEFKVSYRTPFIADRDCSFGGT